MKTKIAFVAALAMISLWWLWPQKVALRETEYDIAMALYRVCNQSSNEGLVKIEALLDEHQDTDSGGTDSPLKPIVATAKSGNWQAAAQACRRILDDQVVR